MTRIPDLQNRGTKVVLVKSSMAEGDPDVKKNFNEVVDMHHTIEIYHEVYTDDLEMRIGLNKDTLPIALAISTLLNPTFGVRSNVVGSGLMTNKQYGRARGKLLQQCRIFVGQFDSGGCKSRHHIRQQS